MRLPPILLLALTFATACADERVDAQAARLTELNAELERLSRDVADLRAKGTPPATGTKQPAAADDATSLRLKQVDAILGTALEQLTRLPRGEVTGSLPGVWRRADKGTQVFHFASDGRLCGWALGADGRSREPFWGRWERHGNVLVQLHDRWVGDHNEVRVVLGTVDALTADKLTLGERLNDTKAPDYARVAPADWTPLRSLHDDRAVPIPGLPDWCLVESPK